MSTRGFTPPEEPEPLPEPGQSEGEPDTRSDEYARDDAPDPELDV